MSSIEAALAAIDSLKPGEKVNYMQVAKKYGVERTTLARRHKGASTSSAIKVQNQLSLHPQQEYELVQYIERLGRQGLPPTRAAIQNFGSQLAGKRVGKSWVDRFMVRHRDHLIPRWTTGIDNNRHKADSGEKYKLYFDLLESKIERYRILPHLIFNMDEKGFMLGVLSRSKRVFSKISLEDGRRSSLIQDGNREWMTLIACICADGSYLEPTLIYQSTSGSIQDSWLQGVDTQNDQVRFCTSPSGWTNNEIGLAWLKQVFDRNTKAKAGSLYRLLILDGHGSHVTMEFIEYCDANKILLAVYPPHATHTLQPLDVSMFKPLSTAYSNEISAFMARSQGLVSMSKRDFYPLFYRAWQASFKAETIQKAFMVTGLSPFNPEVILQKFNTKQSISNHNSDSESSALSASDWRKIRALIDRAVNQKDSKKIEKLHRALHTITAQNSVLKHEAAGLREALINERTRRRRGKALPLIGADEYHGGAVVWSPTKVQEARDRQRLHELEEEQQQREKTEAKELRKAQQQARAAAAETRQLARAEAKLLKERQKVDRAIDQAARKAARKVAQRLQNARKLAKRGNRKRLKASIKATTSKNTVVEPHSGQEPQGGTPGPPPAQSRHGRNIKLPSKYE